MFHALMNNLYVQVWYVYYPYRVYYPTEYYGLKSEVVFPDLDC